MKKLYLLLAAFVLACFSWVFSYADSYTFKDAALHIDVSEKEYEHVITKENIERFHDYLDSINSSVEEYKKKFEDENIILRAIDTKKNRVLSLYAVKDSESERYFDINEQTKETRASYRKLHGSGDLKRAEGYVFNHVDWKRFPKKMDRWLMLRYDYKPDGKVLSRGYQRKTIRNGYTITLELDINSSRSLTGADNSAMNRAFKGLRFEEIFSLPALPVIFNETKTAPAMTTEPKVVLTGKTAPEATLRAAVVSFTTNQNQVIETKAKKNGAYKLEIKFPSEDLYLVTLTVEKEGSIPFEKQYSITYGKGKIAVNIETFLPENLNRDSYTISGMAEKGVEALLSVNNKVERKKVGAKGTFSFTIDTSKEGDYNVILTFSKKNFEAKTYRFSSKRVIDAEERQAKILKSAMEVDYAKLIRNIDKYDGKILSYEGYVLSVKETQNEWLTIISLDAPETTDKRILVVSGGANPGVNVGDKVIIYGQLVGSTFYSEEGKQGRERPKLYFQYIQTIAQ